MRKVAASRGPCGPSARARRRARAPGARERRRTASNSRRPAARRPRQPIARRLAVRAHARDRRLGVARPPAPARARATAREVVADDAHVAVSPTSRAARRSARRSSARPGSVRREERLVAGEHEAADAGLLVEQRVRRRSASSTPGRAGRPRRCAASAAARSRPRRRTMPDGITAPSTIVAIANHWLTLKRLHARRRPSARRADGCPSLTPRAAWARQRAARRGRRSAARRCRSSTSAITPSSSAGRRRPARRRSRQVPLDHLHQPLARRAARGPSPTLPSISPSV